MTLIERDPELAAAAHVARRLSLAPSLSRIQAAAGRPVGDVVAEALADTIDRVEAPAHGEWGPVVTWWLEEMTGPSSGLAERLVWFWHTLLTTSGRKVDNGPLVARQLSTLRREALGDFTSLLTAMVTDPAMLVYLDADGSEASNPNENLGREVMELFSIGLGNYDEADVGTASRILAGKTVDRDRATASLDPDRGLQGAATLLGERRNWTPESMVERLCAHPATARRVSERLWFHFVGTPLDDREATELGRWWSDHDLAVLPLVERILTDDRFATSRWTRPRTGLEFYCATRAAVNFDIIDPWPTERIGQLPYGPPSVAGWPDDRWLSPGSLLGRAAHAQGWWFENTLKRGPADPDTVLDRCGLFEVSPHTLEAMNAIEASTLAPEWRNTARWRLAMASPEFQLA